MTSRSLFAVIEPGSCFVGTLLELALACDRQYMLDGVREDVDPDAAPASIQVTPANLGWYPWATASRAWLPRFYGRDDDLARAAKTVGAAPRRSRGRRGGSGHDDARRPRLGTTSCGSPSRRRAGALA